MTFNFSFGLTIHFSDSVVSQLRNYMFLGDFALEAGGILVGYIEPLKNSITVTDMTYPQPCDKRLPFRFSRKQSGHQTIMDALWKESGFEKMYLGEWHTHSTLTPIPSKLDIREWKKVARKGHNTPNILFLIVGTSETRLWTIRDGIIYSAKEVLK